ncbi:MAG: sulfotransferase [Bacteroidetes bacterium]|nr:sulfotransferase [Bacteroidota bacterium]
MNKFENEIDINTISNLPFFFIIGRPRSGTTLLRYLFDAHPNVIIPTECNFILSLAGRYQNKKEFDKQTLTKFFTDLRQTRFFETLSIDTNLLEKRILDIDKNIKYQTLCKIVSSSYISLNTKKDVKIIGDKNPSYSSENFHKIFQLFPDAKFIHLIRDYHDHIVSMQKGNFKLPSAAYMAILWKKSIRILAKYKKKKPENFFTIKYETFVENPEFHMKDICQFLELPFDKEMFEFITKKENHEALQPNIDFSKQHQSLFKPIDKSRIGKWSILLTGNDLAAVEIVAGKTGKEFGYEYSQHKLKLRILFLLIKCHLLNFIVIILRGFIYSLSVKSKIASQ